MKYTGSADEHIKVGGSFYGYAWFETEDGKEIAVAFKVGRYELVKSPIWNWIEKSRTAEEQQYIEDHFEQMQAMF